MAQDSKYGQVTFEKTPGNPFREDEPVFVIRGRDATAVAAIRLYAYHASENGADPEFVDACYQRAYEFEVWQGDNDKLVKAPD